MQMLLSKIEKQEVTYSQAMGILSSFQFMLGGNWEFDHGYFDKHLDLKHLIWLRIPFEVISGKLESEDHHQNAKIRIGQPFVLKHIYQDGLDASAQIRVIGALIDQFQSPIDPDAPIEPKWVEEASKILEGIEKAWYT